MKSAGPCSVFIVFLTTVISAQQGTINTVAGARYIFSGNNGPAVNVPIAFPQGVAVDTQGNVYIADALNSVVEKVTPSGYLTLIAGVPATRTFTGDGGPATNATVNNPYDVAVDLAGNVYIADYGNCRIRKIDATGIISTIAGNGTCTFGGDNGPATSASLRPYGIGVDGAGTKLYIADSSGHVIRMVDLVSGIITTVAGGGTTVSYGGPATATKLYTPSRAVPGPNGELYVADVNQIVKVVSGTVTAVVPYQSTCPVNFADNVPATSSSVCSAWGLTVDSQGQLYIGDSGYSRLRKIDANGIITTIAGNGVAGWSGDGGPATNAKVNGPQSPAVDASGNVYFADWNNSRIRKVANGIITNFAGNGGYGYGGDSGPATLALFYIPYQLAFDAAGDFLIAEYSSNRVRKIDTAGVVSTIAGSGSPAFWGDGGLATSADVCHPRGIAIDNSGNTYVNDSCNYRIRKIDSTGTITTYAGTGSQVYSGDGGPATAAGIGDAHQLSWLNGKLYLVNGARVRVIDTSTGTITTVAGTGVSGYGPDGVAATASKISSTTSSVVADSAGNVYIADAGNNRIRKVDSSGVISTLAGTGTAGFSGDGGPATAAQVNRPSGLTLDSHGNLLFVDVSNFRIRVVAPAGTIATVAGTGVQKVGWVFMGDGGPAGLAQFSFINSEGTLLSEAATGNLFIIDVGWGTIRRIQGASNPGFVLSTSAAQTINVGGSANYTATITPLSGWTGVVMLDCPGAPAGVSCGFSPPSVTIVDSSPMAATMTLSTSPLTPQGVNYVPVTGSAGTFSSSAAANITVNLLAPTITTLDPATAIAGTAGLTLTANGSNFVPASVVQWNGSSRTTTFVSDTQITAAITPTDLAASGTPQITVFNPAPGGGTSAALALAVNNPLPVLTSLNPPIGSVNSGDVTITLTGSGFVSISVVQWNGTNRATTFLSGTQLTTTIPSSDLATVGTASVTVVNGAPGGGTSAPVTFTIRPLYPVGDVYPNSCDDAGGFSDSSLNNLDLIATLRAVVNLPGMRPSSCSDRFDAMDAYPADGASRGGDGVLNNLDLILTLRRITNIDSSQPMRPSRLAFPCPPPGMAAASRPQTTARAAAAGGLEFGTPDGAGRIPVHLRAFRKIDLAGLSFGLGTPGGVLQFRPADLTPSLLDTAQPGRLAVAWFDPLTMAGGSRILLGYITARGPLEIYDIVANDAGGSEVPLRVLSLL